MAIGTFRIGARAVVGAASATPALPSGLATDDFLLLIDRQWRSDTTALGAPTTPSGGWTLLTSLLAPATTSPDRSVRRTYYWRRWASGVTAPTIAAVTNAQEHSAQIVSPPGVITTGDPVQELGTGTWSGAATDTMSVPNGVASVAGGVVIVDATRDNDFIDGVTIATLTGDGLTWVEIDEYGGGGGENWAWAWDYALTPAATTITAKSFAMSGNTTSNRAITQMLALRPEPDGPTATAAAPLGALTSSAVATTATIRTATAAAPLGPLVSSAAAVVVAPPAPPPDPLPPRARGWRPRAGGPTHPPTVSYREVT